MATEAALFPGRRAWRLAGLALFLASFLVVKPLWRLLGLHGPERLVLLLIPAAAILLFARALRRGACSDEALRPALRRYVGRLAACLLGYLGLMVAAGVAEEGLGLTGPALASLRLLPALPVLGCVFVIGRYLVEEEDEYLRLRAAQASLIGTGVLLAAAILWGFLEQAGLAGAVRPGWAFPLWAAGMGLGQALLRVRA